MSGEEVVLVADPSSVPYRAVAHLRDLDDGLPGFALIGGLAVMLRLGQAHRATNDVDAVSDDQTGLLEVLVARGHDRRGDSVALDADLELDVIDVIDVSEGDPDYVPYATHRFAFDTRAPVAVAVRPASGGPPATTTVEVARASALVAVKLGISEGVGRQRDPRKVGSDAFDVVRLLESHGPDSIADELNGLGDLALVERVRTLAEHHLVAQVDRLTAAIRRSAVQGVRTVEPELVELLGRAFARQLRRR